MKILVVSPSGECPVPVFDDEMKVVRSGFEALNLMTGETFDEVWTPNYTTMVIIIPLW